METAYGDTDYDLFAGQVPSPLFQRIGQAYLGVLASREYAAAASEASALESPRMPPVRITGQRRPYHSRVILSSSGSSSSPMIKSHLNDPCCICGAEDGDLVYVCEGGAGCTVAVHAKCLRSRQVFKFQAFRCSYLFRVRRKIKGKWRCDLCKIARKALLLHRKNNCMCV